MHPVHRDLYDIRRCSLDRRIHCDTFPEGALHEIAGSKLRHRTSSSKHGAHIAVLFRSRDQTVQKRLDPRISLKVPLNIRCRFFSCDAEILA